jgi:hypothetical protein
LHRGESAVHDVEVPTNLKMSDLHDALLDSDYHTPQPTADGAVENSPTFKKAASDLYARTTANKETGVNQGREWGYVVGSNGEIGKTISGYNDPNSLNGHLHFEVGKNDMGTVHTHDMYHQSDPSTDDIDAAKKAKKTIWVVSRDGIWAVDPGGSKTRVYSSPGDMANKNKKAK